MTQQSNFAIDTAVTSSLDAQPIVDIHTHLCPLSMPDLALYGPDELVTYHYLKAETSRQLPQGISVTEFNGMAKPDQADVIWKALFVGDSSPVSEAQLGIVTVMSALGLDPRAPDLSEFRQFCSQMPPEDYFNMVFEKAGVATVYMTNDPLDELEGPVWKKGIDLDPRFKAVLRLDRALMGWPDPVEKLRAEGYEVETELTEKTFAELRRYLNDWCDRIDARYMAISLPPDFAYPDETGVGRLMQEAVYPTARDRKIPTAMMVGVKRQVNPELKDGGDGLGKWEIGNLERIARDWPDVRFMITILSRENQHELCIAARKFPNITPFGCWWFLNNPSIIQEVTAERIELLGTSFIPQHSDARILDQLLYKWPHSKRAIAPVLTRKYEDLKNAGWPLTEADIKRDVGKLFGGGGIL